MTVAAVGQEILSAQSRSGMHEMCTTWHLVISVILCSLGAVYGYDTKKADSEGLALGTVVLPWTLTALLITDLQKKASSGMSCGSVYPQRSALTNSEWQILLYNATNSSKAQVNDGMSAYRLCNHAGQTH